MGRDFNELGSLLVEIDELQAHTYIHYIQMDRQNTCSHQKFINTYHYQTHKNVQTDMHAYIHTHKQITNRHVTYLNLKKLKHTDRQNTDLY